MKELNSEQLLSLSKSELVTIILTMRDHISLLEARIVELEEKLKEKPLGMGKQMLPSFIKLNVQSGKKGKRKQRTKGYVRMKDTPTHEVFHSYETCPKCSGELGKPSVAYSRQIIDIPMTSATVTDHVVFKRMCFSCQQRVYPTPDLSSYVVGKQRIGMNLMALIATMREELRLPIQKIQEHLQIFYHLKISTGEIVEICHTVSGFGAGKYEKIKEELLKSPALHADETGGRENGKNGYWWNFSNDQFQFLLYRKSRGSKVVTEVMGEEGVNYEGVLITDFYTAYNTYLGFHQRCWVHYLRDIHLLTEAHPDDTILKQWAEDIHRLYERAKAYTGPPDSLPVGKQAMMREEKEKEYKEELLSICKPYLFQKTVFSTLNARAYKYVSELFTFIRFPRISSDNNMAERAVRHMVVSRKISGGTRSIKGSETKAILASLFGTWRLQHLNPFEQTKLLLLSASCQRL